MMFYVPLIERVREACRNSHQQVENHIEDILHMVEIGSGTQRELQDILLSRYACYLIVQNGAPSKPVIAVWERYNLTGEAVGKISTTFPIVQSCQIIYSQSFP